MRRSELGMAMFLIAEFVFFFLLILAFVYFRAIPRGIAPLGWFFTALLLASNFSMWQAPTGSHWWRCVTIALGVAFLIYEAILFGNTFFILAGIHGLHILAGLIALVAVPAPALRAVAFYWYFFAAVWLAIVLVIYVRSVA
jgi:cytochrome c oxidase subunit III